MWSRHAVWNVFAPRMGCHARGQCPRLGEDWKAGVGWTMSQEFWKPEGDCGVTQMQPARSVLRLLAAALDSQLAYGAALGVVLEELLLPAGTFYTYEPDTARLVPQTTISRCATGAVTTSAAIGSGLAADCVRERRTVVLAGPLADAAGELANQYGAQPGALIARPLLLRGRMLGALVVVTPPERHDLTATEWSLLAACSDALAVAIGHQALRVSELERVKASVVDVLSHELRTPLTSLLGYLEVLADGDAGDLTEEQRDYISIIDASARRLHRQVDDMLTLSRITSGELRLAERDVPLRELVDTALVAIHERAASRHLTLDARIEDDLPAVSADPEVVRQALGHLLDNALKCAPHGGSVRVRVARAGGGVLVSVANTGSYLEPDERRQVFTAFYRTAAAERDAVQGAGLGLCIARSLVERAGGQMWVESSADEGTTFYFTLIGAPRFADAHAQA